MIVVPDLEGVDIVEQLGLAALPRSIHDDAQRRTEQLQCEAAD